MSIYEYADKDSDADPAKGIPADKEENELNKITKPVIQPYKTFMGTKDYNDEHDVKNVPSDPNETNKPQRG